MEYDVEIYSLTTQFFNDYPYAQYPEITTKIGRPYSCLLIEYLDDTFICIPFRSHVRHKYAYHFKGSLRSKKGSSGLDYTKAILIKNNDYLNLSVAAIVDQDEYKETVQNMPRIVREVYAFISDYKDHLNGRKLLHPQEWQRRYGRSTLPYFDDFLRDK